MALIDIRQKFPPSIARLQKPVESATTPIYWHSYKLFLIHCKVHQFFKFDAPLWRKRRCSGSIAKIRIYKGISMGSFLVFSILFRNSRRCYDFYFKIDTLHNLKNCFSIINIKFKFFLRQSFYQLPVLSVYVYGNVVM